MAFVARQLVGLFPVIGIVPKVAVSYAGTYAIGQAIYQWCISGVKVSPGTLKSMYRKAMERGQEVARRLVTRQKTEISRISIKTGRPPNHES
jgi:hypothetical protein